MKKRGEIPEREAKFERPYDLGFTMLWPPKRQVMPGKGTPESRIKRELESQRAREWSRQQAKDHVRRKLERGLDVEGPDEKEPPNFLRGW